MAAGCDFLGDIAEFHQAGAGGLFLHKGADAGNPGEVAIGGEFAERPVGGHAADAEAFDEFVFGGHAGAGGPGAGLDMVEDVLLHLHVERLHLVHGRVPLMSSPFLMTAARGLKPRG